MPPEPAAITARRGTNYGTCPRCRRPLSPSSTTDDAGRVVSIRCRCTSPKDKPRA
ncbi:hypothetical protein ACIGW3_26395 [Streptomyces sp. NPDC053499]|uniref:hypothetical protein n=1 Tax=Streptomyces sp. NPDC053499 TaxID=3365707 RepID=UPI0037CF614E